MSKPHEATFEVFYDGDCPVCRREIELLRRLDRRRGHVRFTDITQRTFEPALVGKTKDELMARIHGRDLANDAIVEGVEVFRRLYAAVGFGYLVTLTRLPPISWALERAYAWFAANRLRLTGRACSAESCAAKAD